MKILPVSGNNEVFDCNYVLVYKGVNCGLFDLEGPVINRMSQKCNLNVSFRNIAQAD